MSNREKSIEYKVKQPKQAQTFLYKTELCEDLFGLCLEIICKLEIQNCFTDSFGSSKFFVY